MKIALYFCSPFLLKSINQKKFLLIFSCFFLSYVGIAQINIDSLKKIVDSKLHDTIRSEAASRIAFELSDNDPDQSIIYGLLAKNIAEKFITIG